MRNVASSGGDTPGHHFGGTESAGAGPACQDIILASEPPSNPAWLNEPVSLDDVVHLPAGL